MLIQQKSGNIHSYEIKDRVIDLLPVEWYETNKRIMHKHTRNGIPVVMKFLNKDPDLSEGDVIYDDGKIVVMVDIIPCDVIVIRPGTMYQMACLCYEIGNKHLPLFYEQHDVLTPFEAPLFKLLASAGFEPVQQQRKLLHQLKTNVSLHNHKRSDTGLFSRILQFTTPSADV